MKTYIFVIRRITYISGAIQYVYNKTNYLESKGWRVLIFSALHGPLYVEQFRKYKDSIYPQLYLTPNCFSKKEVNKVLNKILLEVGDSKDGRYIVESDAVQRAVWAELIASRLNCRHLCLFVRERHLLYNHGIRKYLKFKYDRHELAGISDDSICQMFDDENIVKRDDTRFSAVCNNVIEPCEDRYTGQLREDADYTLGSLGRLEKPCVPKIVTGIKAFISKNPNKIFNVVFIGGSTVKERVEYIKDVLGNCSNIKLLMTGNMYPIPASFAKKMDVFVSTAGSASATYNFGIPTVRVNPVTGSPLGVVGLDFMPGGKSMFDTSEMAIEECIENALLHKDEIVFPTSKTDYYKKMYAEFDRQLSFVCKADKTTFYEEEKLMRIKTPNNYKTIAWMIGHIFGARGIQYYWNITRNKGSQSQIDSYVSYI